MPPPPLARSPLRCAKTCSRRQGACLQDRLAFASLLVYSGDARQVCVEEKALGVLLARGTFWRPLILADYTSPAL
eukprot:458533-Amphidinium_carterae.1